jgi:AraC family transcriptional activator of mtrCDE
MDQQLALPALQALPQAVSLRAGMEPGRSPLSDTLRMLRNEVETPDFGNQIIVRNLLSSLFEAGLLRAAFARNFSASMGEPPHSYLTRWRMGIAARLLEDADLQLSEIALRVGYQSEFSFSRAFKSARGVSPTQYRRAAANRAGPLPM